MKLAIASDHGGYALKEAMKKHLKSQNIAFVDCGTDSEDSCDYPDFAEKACRLVQQGEADFGVLICGTGIGMSITANKMNGIRAALCGEPFLRISPGHIMMPMFSAWGHGSPVPDWQK